MKKNVLVLGAAGFIGSRVVAALSRTQWAQPTAAGRRSSLELQNLETQIFDATDENALCKALVGVDAVVNCVAGNAQTIVANAHALFSSTGHQTMPPRIIYLSSMAVYGSAEGLVDEQHSLSGDAGAYAEAKLQAERMASKYPSAVILRPGCVYGPESPQWSGRIARWLLAHRLGDLGAAGDGFCNLIHVDDLVAAVLVALWKPQIEGEIFNIAQPAPPTWNEYFVRYARSLGAVPVRRISQRRLTVEAKLLAPPLKVLEILTGKVGRSTAGLPAPMPPSLLRLWRQEIRLDVDKAERMLNLSWTPLDTGLRETAGWVRAC